MSGYTPLFQSVFTGTLFGKYPDTAAWIFFLALADKHGDVDMTPEYISSVTGMPVADLLGCIARFMEPDPRSRSTAEEGRRLIPLDGQRSWGWRIVNFTLYRERARLMAKNEREVSSGKNAERLTAAHRRSPPVTPADPLSNANADTDTNQEREQTRGVLPRGSALTQISGGEAWRDVTGIDASAFQRWLGIAETRGKVLDGAARLSLAKWLAGKGSSQAAIVEQSERGGWKNLRELETSGKRSASIADRLAWRPEGA